MEDIAQGNLTRERLSQDVNATKEKLKREAAEHINQSLNLTAEQLQKRAKEELQSQVIQKVQQPGFESLLALIGILGAAFILGRRN